MSGGRSGVGSIGPREGEDRGEHSGSCAATRWHRLHASKGKRPLDPCGCRYRRKGGWRCNHLPHTWCCWQGGEPAVMPKPCGTIGAGGVTFSAAAEAAPRPDPSYLSGSSPDLSPPLLPQEEAAPLPLPPSRQPAKRSTVLLTRREEVLKLQTWFFSLRPPSSRPLVPCPTNKLHGGEGQKVVEFALTGLSSRRRAERPNWEQKWQRRCRLGGGQGGQSHQRLARRPPCRQGDCMRCWH